MQTLGQHPRILVVDDDPESGRALADWLGVIGCSVVFADGPKAAETALAGDRFDVVLSDIQMPGNSRLQWVEQLTRGESAPPVVLLTGDPSMDTAIRAANLPVAAYLLKPVDHAALLPLLRRLTDDGRQRVEMRRVADQISGLLDGADRRVIPDEAQRNVLRLVARSLGSAATVVPRGAGSPAAAAPDSLRSAIVEAIDVIGRTKGSFRSKDLGALRLRLQSLIDRAA